MMTNHCANLKPPSIKVMALWSDSTETNCFESLLIRLKNILREQYVDSFLNTGNTGKISRKERQRRRNLRLSKILQPKNAVMILNELVKSATYTVSDLPLPSEMNQYTANVLVDGVSHIGHGKSQIQ